MSRKPAPNPQASEQARYRVFLKALLSGGIVAKKLIETRNPRGELILLEYDELEPEERLQKNSGRRA